MKTYIKFLFLMSIFAFSACQKSNNNFLKNIEISSGKLIPEFSKDISTYSISSLNTLREIQITAEVDDINSDVVINRLKGTTQKFKLDVLCRNVPIVIKVIAENGDVRKYKIKTLPDDFPPISVREKTKPSKGYIFLSNFSFNTKLKTGFGKYLMIIDNFGTPVYYRKFRAAAGDFKLQPDGTYSFFITDTIIMPEFFGYISRLDTNFNQIAIYKTKHGYTDMHEFRVLENGNFMCFGVDMVEKNFKSISSSNKTKIWDYYIEETDKEGNVIMNWQSLDHFIITDIISNYDLTVPYIEQGFNCNSLWIDEDENIILSSRKLDEITKIDRKTGKILWRMGGIKCKNNQFKFFNDPLNGFSHQHSISILDNGNILLFDNGNHNAEKTGKDNIFFIPESRVVEYKIDEKKKTATLVWEYIREGVFAPIMGSAQRLKNGNTLICWSKDSPCITEVNPKGQVVLEIDLPKGFSCFSAYKFEIN